MLSRSACTRRLRRVAGAVDIGYSNVISLTVAASRGVPVTIAAAAGLYSAKAPTSVLMVAKDSPIRTARDCNGKTIAVNGLKNITQFAPQAWIDKNGGDSTTVKFLELRFPEMAPALAQTMARATYADRLTAEELQPSIDVALKYGGLAAPVRAADLIWSGA